MKRILLLGAVLISGSMAFSQLSGNYTVYGTSPDYATIQDACTALQTNGQSGPVVFNIRDGVHNEAVTLTAVSGNSSANSITFQSESNDSTAVTVASAAGNTFTFTGVNYVNFNNIGLSFTGASGNVVQFNNGGDSTIFNMTAVYYNAINGPSAINANGNVDINNFYFGSSTLSSNYRGIEIFSSADVNSLSIEGSTIDIINSGDALNISAANTNKLQISNSDLTAGPAFGNGAYITVVSGSADSCSITNSTINASSGNGFYLNLLSGNANNFSISGSTINSSSDGLNLYANSSANGFSVTDTDISADSGDGIYLNANAGSANNISIANSTVSSNGANAFYANSNMAFSNGTISNSEFTAGGSNGVYLSTGGNVSDWSVTNTKISSNSDAFYANSWGGGNLQGFSFQNDSLIVNPTFSGYALFLDGSGMTNISVEDSYLENDSLMSWSDVIYLTTWDELSNVTINNNEIKGYGGVNLSGSGLSMIEMDNNDISTHYNAIYYSNGPPASELTFTNNTIASGADNGISMDCGGGFADVIVSNNDIWSSTRSIYFGTGSEIANFTIDNNMLYADNNDGMYLYGDNGMTNVEITNNGIEAFANAVDLGTWGTVSNITLSNNTAYSDDTDGYYFSFNGPPSENIQIMNDSIEALGYGVYMENWNGLSDVNIENTYVYSQDDGIYIYTGDDMENINISGCEIYADTAGCCADGIEMYSDWAGLTNVTVEDNEIYAYESGVYLYGDSDNATNTVVANNEITAGDYGVYMYGAGNNTRVDSNNVYPNLNNSTQTNYGVYAYGDNGPSTGFSVQNNFMENVSSYGVYVEYMDEVTIQENEMHSTESNNSFYGVYCFEMYNGGSLINRNKILTEGEYIGVYLYNVYLTSTDPIVVSNNFITGCTYSVFTYDANGVDYIHNSMSSGSNLQMAYFEISDDINIWNNIFKNHNTSGDIYFVTSTPNINIDYNAYYYDTTATNMSSGGDLGTFASPYDFMTGSSYDANSMYQDPGFVHDTTDLHVNCSATALNAGTAVGVTTDIDGLNRNTTPTIGAHEISPAITDLIPDSVWFCNTAEIGTSVAGDYLWSTSETTSSITVNDLGMYYLTLTDACGNDHEDSTLAWTDMPTADFVVGTNGLQAVFNNQSVGGDSYLWDFGDGNTSTDMNPIHDYSATGSYTVLLTVTNACGGTDTISQDLEIFVLGVDEATSLEDRGFNVYPNPTQGDVTVDFAMLLGEDITLYVTDMDGRVVYTDMISNQMGGYQKQLSLNNLSDGMYLLRVDTETESITKRIVKQ